VVSDFCCSLWLACAAPDRALPDAALGSMDGTRGAGPDLNESLFCPSIDFRLGPVGTSSSNPAREPCLDRGGLTKFEGGSVFACCSQIRTRIQTLARQDGTLLYVDNDRSGGRLRLSGGL
jgi:hypothetical protein